MNEIMRETLFNQLRDWILQAGVKIRENMHRPLTIDIKSNPSDLVTGMDHEVEFFFVSKIRHNYPDHKMLTEEGFGDQPTEDKGIIWIIDPIDGTMNFVNQKKNFAISIGIYYDGVGEIGMIYDVMNNQLYSAKRGDGAYRNNEQLQPLGQNKQLSESIICLNHHWLTPNKFVEEEKIHKLVRDVRGTRSYGSAALEFASVAEGSADAYITMRLSPWDFAAGRIILNEVGGVMTDTDGQAVHILEKTSVLACNPAIQKVLIHNYLIRKT